MALTPSTLDGTGRSVIKFARNPDAGHESDVSPLRVVCTIRGAALPSTSPTCPTSGVPVVSADRL